MTQALYAHMNNNNKKKPRQRQEQRQEDWGVQNVSRLFVQACGFVGYWPAWELQ
jgi:hypothetical protein